MTNKWWFVIFSENYKKWLAKIWRNLHFIYCKRFIGRLKWNPDTSTCPGLPRVITGTSFTVLLCMYTYILICNILKSTTMDKIFETKSTFPVKQGTTGKVQFVFFTGFFLVLKIFSFWEEDWALGYNSMRFWDFPDIS